MSEKLSTPDQLPQPEQHQALPTPEQAEPLRPGETDPRKPLQEARQQIAETTSTSNAAEALQAAERAAEAPQAASASPLSGEVKKLSLNRELKQLRRQLPLPSRALSRVVHQPVIRQLSQLSAQTIGRPSGLLGGGLMAFAGTTAYLLFSRHYSYTYNYLIFSLLLGAGFVVGLTLESLFWIASKRRRGLD